MKTASFAASVFLFLASTTMLAQDPTPPEKEPPPDPPLMDSAPADSQWTITLTPKNPEKDPVSPEDVRAQKLRQHYSPIVLSKHVLKSAGQVVIYTNYEAGIKSESWIVGGYLYELPYRDGQSIHINTRGQGDFPEIYWVNAENFRGTVALKGAKVHLYETDTLDSLPGPSASPRPGASPSPTPVKTKPRRAYIDVKTRLPVAVDFGDIVWTYQYSGPATTFPTPDDRIKKIMRDAPALKKR